MIQLALFSHDALILTKRQNHPKMEHLTSTKNKLCCFFYKKIKDHFKMFSKKSKLTLAQKNPANFQKPGGSPKHFFTVKIMSPPPIRARRTKFFPGGGGVETCNYRRVPIVATLVTFGISSLWGSLLSGGRYFRGTKIVYK